MDTDFKIKAGIVISHPQDPCVKKMLKQNGFLLYDASKRSFSAIISDKTILELSANQLYKLRRDKCPNGRNYIIRFAKPSQAQAMELILKEIDQLDKEKLHSCLLKLVGVEGDRAKANPKPDDRRLLTSASSFSGNNFASMNDKVEIKRPNDDKIVSKRLFNAPITPSLLSSLPVEGYRAKAAAKADASRLITPVKYEIHAKKRLRLSPPLFDNNKENIDKERTSTAVNNDVIELDNNITEFPRPGSESSELPEYYTRSGFWSELRLDNKLRSGKSGEWVKGQDERLTIDGLLCLRDGEWLNADIIDAYLNYICKSTTHAHFVPTYAILSFERKKKIPSEWYWPLASTDVVFAPAHLNNNHWAMAIVYIAQKRLVLMDSMNHDYTSPAKEEFMETILSILFEVAAQQNVDIGGKDEWDVKEQLAVPQQNNGIDCGIFALMFAKYEAQKRAFDFEQRHIPYFRRRICHDIISAVVTEVQ